jgi:uncharacterized protein
MTNARFEHALTNLPGRRVTVVGTIAMTGFILLCWLSGLAVMGAVNMSLYDFTTNLTLEVSRNNELTLAVFLLVLGFGAGLVAVLFVRRGLEKRPLISLVTAASHFRWSTVLAAFAIVVISSFALTYLTDSDASGVFDQRLTDYGLGGFLAVLGLYLVGFSIQSTFEEVFVRGWLTQRFCAHGWSVWVAALASTLIFVALHWSPDIGPTYLASVLAMALMFAWSAIRLNGLEFAIGAHVGNNFVVGGLFAGLINGQGYAEQDGAWIGLAIYLVLFGGLIEAFARFPARDGLARSGLPALPRLSLRA